MKIWVKPLYSTSSCPVIILNEKNGECSIHNALLPLLSLASVTSVSQSHFHILAQMFDYLQLKIIVRLKALVILQFLSAQIQIQF